LSLWLATLCRDRPLTFFDRQLRAGNSLVGAALRDVSTRASGGGRRRVELPLFDQDDVDGALRVAVNAHISLREGPEETLDDVRSKDRAFKTLISESGPVARWKQVCDFWCAAWFADDVRGMRRAVFQSMLEPQTLPEHIVKPLLNAAQASAKLHRFFHWTLEFPEVFFTHAGEPRVDAGFDAVIGNPPWEMLRRDRATPAGDRAENGRDRLLRFTRGSGLYPAQGNGHANFYQLFSERAVSLSRRGGRVGLVLPAGLANDHGSGQLRRHLLDRTSIDSLVAIDNRNGIFPVHRGLRFLLITTSVGGRTHTIPLRSGLHTAADFDSLPETGADPAAVNLPRDVLERLGGSELAIPDVRTHEDVAIAARLAFAHPAIGDEEGWALHFGRELNATDDKEHFTSDRTAKSLPIVEGKQIVPFRCDISTSQSFIDSTVATRLIHERTHSRSRLAYRDVAASTNRQTLIAAILPDGVVTTHTLFCLKTPADEDVQHFLCGLFNSFVANYLVRMRVTTHVTVAVIDRLPVPRPDRKSSDFIQMAAIAREMAADSSDTALSAQHQALAAHLYGLTSREFEHILRTFPLVDTEDRRRVLDAFLRTL
jgi:hypothetical protein